MLKQNKPSEKKINQWCEFIKKHLSIRSIVIDKEDGCSVLNPDNLDNEIRGRTELDTEHSFLVNAESIKQISDLLPVSTNNIADKALEGWNTCKNNIFSIATSAKYKNYEQNFKKMRFFEYLIWRLEAIKTDKEDKEKPISVKATIGLAFSSLAGMYWFFTPKIKPPIKILMGVLNLLIVAALVCSIVLNLSIYFLLPAAIVYGLFAIADCIHVGLKRYKENVEYQAFTNQYKELMAYLKQGQTKPPESLNNKINNIQEKEMNIIKEENEDSKSDNEEEKSF